MVEALIIAFVLALVCGIVIAVLIKHTKAVAARPALRQIDAASARIRAIGRPRPTLTLRYTFAWSLRAERPSAGEAARGSITNQARSEDGELLRGWHCGGSGR